MNRRGFRLGIIITASLIAALVAIATRVGLPGRSDEALGSDTLAIGDTTVIDGTMPSCTECTLEVTKAATLGTQTDADIPQRVPSMIRDGRGYHYLVFNGWINKPILRYDSTGRFLGKLGRYGQGPGEYSMTFSAFNGPGDSLYVWAERRLQVFGPDGNYGRSIRVARGTPIGLVANGGGAIYSRETVSTADSKFASVIRVFDSAGVMTDSFPLFHARFLGEAKPVTAPDGSLWSYMHGNYRLERHARDGDVERLLGVALPASADGPARMTRPILTRAQADSIVREKVAANTRRPVTAPPKPSPRYRTSMVIDSEGLLWVARTVPAPGWEAMSITPKHLSPNEAPGEVTIPRDQEDRMHHTMVEVIDPRRAQLLARTELPFLGTLAAPGYVGRVTIDDDGFYVTEVYRVVLERREVSRLR